MTDLVDDRLLPLASLRVYARGQGDPYLYDRGFRWYQPLAELGESGEISVTGEEPALELLPEVGLVCRPYLRLRDTRLADWELHDSGDWDERLPGGGAPRRYRLVQLNSAANLRWFARSTFLLPGSPHVAFSLALMPPPPDHDAEADPPHARIELGGGAWALQWNLNGGGILLQGGRSGWIPAAELPDLPDRDRTGVDEAIVLIRPLRGMLGISLDFGHRYSWIRDPAGAALQIPAGRVRVSGAGGQCIFGLHQIEYRAGSLISPARPTHTRRLFAAATLQFRGALPAGTSVALFDRGQPPAAAARWEALLTPGAARGPRGWNCAVTPEVHAVEYSLPVIRTGGRGDWSAPWDGSIESAVVERPEDLAGGVARVRIRLDSAGRLQYSAGRWPRVELLLGHTRSGGPPHWFTSFGGYVRDFRAGADSAGRAWIDLEIENASIRFRRAVWAEGETAPLGGRSLNAALDRVLESEGLLPDDRLWHAAGSLIMLPAGSPEQPAFYPRAGENKWETLEMLCRWCGLEIGVLNDGRLSTIPRNRVEPSVSHTWRQKPEERLSELMLEADYGLDSSASRTAVLLRGRDPAGRSLMAYAVDVQAEQWPISPRFSPWRELLQEELPGRVTIGFLVFACLNRFLEETPPRQELELEAPVQLDLRRRQRVRVEGPSIGASGFEEFAVTALRHQYQADPSFARLTSRVRLRRIY